MFPRNYDAYWQGVKMNYVVRIFIIVVVKNIQALSGLDIKDWVDTYQVDKLIFYMT